MGPLTVLYITKYIPVFEGIHSWSVWHISRSSAVHGLRGAQERLQQVQESSLRYKAGESLTPIPALCVGTCLVLN